MTTLYLTSPVDRNRAANGLAVNSVSACAALNQFLVNGQIEFTAVCAEKNNPLALETARRISGLPEQDIHNGLPFGTAGEASVFVRQGNGCILIVMDTERLIDLANDILKAGNFEESQPGFGYSGRLLEVKYREGQWVCTGAYKVLAGEVVFKEIAPTVQEDDALPPEALAALAAAGKPEVRNRTLSIIAGDCLPE